MTTTHDETGTRYHRSALWRIGFFTLNNSATNIYLFTLGFLSYYAAGIVGLAVLLVSTLLGAIRVFDGLIDPFIGALIDRLESRWGKYRPLMIAGNLILALSYLMIFSTHQLPDAARIAFLVVALLVHKVGYSLQNSVTKAGQTVMTNDPKQRPLYTIFDSIYNAVVYGGGQVLVASVLIARHGDFTLELFAELIPLAVAVSFALTVLAVVGIWKKDRTEYFGLGEETVSTRGFREYWSVIKGNRPLLLLTASAAADKVASQTKNQAVVTVMLFGIVIGDYAMSGTVSVLSIVPTILIVLGITALATRRGLKSAYVLSVCSALVLYIALAVIVLTVNPSQLSLSGGGVLAVAFLILFMLGASFVGAPTTLVVPMIADVSDYETSRSGRYVAGMLGNIFSMIDQLISSLAPVIVGIVVAFIGFEDRFPTVSDELTTTLLLATVALAFLIPAGFLLISLICMRFYTLDGKRMEKVQADIAARKEQTIGENEVLAATSVDA
jgi:Na+/melibiose symporter-like transporter